jgi:flagellar biosynthesis/type III secretory pathway ATPase
MQPEINAFLRQLTSEKSSLADTHQQLRSLAERL